MGYVRHRSLLPVGQPLTVEAVVRSAGVNDAAPFPGRAFPHRPPS